MRRTWFFAVLLVLPIGLSAQARFITDPKPRFRDPRGTGGAQVKQLPAASPRRPVAAQFDRGGESPMGVVGDTVTIFYFPDGANLSRARQARITSRQRFLPPSSWRAACDNVAHPGWFYGLDAPATSSFAVVVPGRHELPAMREAPPVAKAGAQRYFRAWADSVYARYEAKRRPSSDRARNSLRISVYGEAGDAGWSRTRMWGVRGPNGHNYGVFSIWMRDDQSDGTPNSTATWVVNAWGYPVMRAEGNFDIYGVSDSDGDGVDEVITSNGLIRWNGTEWLAPPVYQEEPCMLKRVTSPPPGWTPDQ
ncbi:MAG TPA: hypothetical protein PLL69_07015 [Gemmatimonadales bacterium]|nr:hypothetical protein [Gemmatimonadales bacterium]